MVSLWTKTASLPEFGRLEGDIRTDVLVIGGGMAGILCSYMLKQTGIDCVLVEADRICGGVTQNTTAKITSQHGLIYDKLLNTFGVEKARMYLDANQAAIKKYRELCADIDCDFEEKDAYVYSRTNRDRLEDEVSALDRLGFHAELTDDPPLPFPVVGAVRFSRQAQFHPLKFASKIAAELNIYEHTRVRELIGLTAVTDHGRIKAKRIIAATHFPFINKHGSYFLKLYQSRSYVLALKNAADVQGMYVDEAQSSPSFRNVGDMLLLGGGSHRTGMKSEGWAGLTDFASRYYPNAKEVCRWATQDCMTLDDVPYIGPYSANTDGLFVATGFNKWGMTSSMAAAMLLCDLVQGKHNPYAALFSPSRTVLRSQLAVNAADAVVNLLTPTVPRCPHMGCALKWNAQERSWDCPCHGSRFTEDGKLLDNPATDGLKNQ